MKSASLKLITSLICTGALLAGSWTYAQDSQTSQQSKPTSKVQIIPPQLPTQPASVSAETLRLLEMIERKNHELKKREEELLLKEKNLQELEKKILSDLQKIEEALARSEEMVGIKKDLIEKNVKALVKAYSNMKPVQAAALLERMDEGTAIIIISRMKSRVAGKVLGAMNTRIAKNISEKIAGKNNAGN